MGYSGRWGGGINGVDTTTPRNFAFECPGIVGAIMNTQSGEPFGESFEGMSWLFVIDILPGVEIR